MKLLYSKLWTIKSRFFFTSPTFENMENQIYNEQDKINWGWLLCYFGQEFQVAETCTLSYNHMHVCITLKKLSKISRGRSKISVSIVLSSSSLLFPVRQIYAIMVSWALTLLFHTNGHPSIKTKIHKKWSNERFFLFTILDCSLSFSVMFSISRCGFYLFLTTSNKHKCFLYLVKL